MSKIFSRCFQFQFPLDGIHDLIILLLRNVEVLALLKWFYMVILGDPWVHAVAECTWPKPTNQRTYALTSGRDEEYIVAPGTLNPALICDVFLLYLGQVAGQQKPWDAQYLAIKIHWTVNFWRGFFLFSSIPESPKRDAGNWRTGPWKQKPGRVMSTDLKQNSSSEILDLEPKRPFWEPEVSNMFWWFSSPFKDDWGQKGWNLFTMLRYRNRLS
jgi:hypothetical protein